MSNHEDPVTTRHRVTLQFEATAREWNLIYDFLLCQISGDGCIFDRVLEAMEQGEFYETS